MPQQRVNPSQLNIILCYKKYNFGDIFQLQVLCIDILKKQMAQMHFTPK